jgi:hypothetical protein
MVQRGQRLRLSLEAHQAIGIGREQLGQDLDGDIAVEVRIARAIDLAHAARAEGGDEFMGAKTGAAAQRHCLRCSSMKRDER